MKIRIRKDSHSYRTLRVLNSTRDYPHDVIEESESLYWVSCDKFKVSIPKEDCEIVQEEPIKPILKPFTFEEWNKDRSQPVWTTNYEKVEQLTCFNIVHGTYPFTGVIDGAKRAFTIAGKGTATLMLESKEKEYYVNVYRHTNGNVYMGYPGTKESCDKNSGALNYLTTISFKC